MEQPAGKAQRSWPAPVSLGGTFMWPILEWAAPGKRPASMTSADLQHWTAGSTALRLHPVTTGLATPAPTPAQVWIHGLSLRTLEDKVLDNKSRQRPARTRQLGPLGPGGLAFLLAPGSPPSESSSRASPLDAVSQGFAFFRICLPLLPTPAHLGRHSLLCVHKVPSMKP